MTRHIIAKEGSPMVEGGIVIEEGALTWDEGAIIPVTQGFGDHEVIGRATDIRREENGNITANIEFLPPRTETFSISVAPFRTREDKRFVIEGKIREVTELSQDEMPWPN